MIEKTFSLSNNISFKSRYFNNEYYNDEEENIVKRIAETRLRKWPQGLNEHNKFLYGIDKEFKYLEKPQTDSAFQKILLSQEIPVPPKPPEYYRLGDKLFNTQKWKDFQKWPEYIQKTALYEKLMKLIDFLRAENLELEKLKLEEAAKKNFQSAFVKSQLIQEFLCFFNSKSSSNESSIPNAIMIEGSNKKENQETIQWLIGRTNAAYKKVEKPYPNISNEDYLSIIDTVLDEAKDRYESSNQRTVLYVEDFENLIKNSAETGDVKELLPTLNANYKTTLVFETTNSKELDPIALQEHRVGLKIKIKDNITSDDFKKLQLDFLKANMKKIDGTDGYRFNYLPGESKHVDLYIGCFGTNDKILWLEHKSAEDIIYATKFIDAIKQLKYFKNVEKIQCSVPNDLSELRKIGYTILSAITKDMKAIIEKRL